MAEFTKDAQKLLDEIGGEENINAVTHFVTRMRFVLNDSSKANIKAIEEIPSIPSCIQYTKPETRSYQWSLVSII